jgi:hypothetical protein
MMGKPAGLQILRAGWIKPGRKIHQSASKN